MPSPFHSGNSAPASHAGQLSSSIIIERPAETLFALWRKPETLPVLMDHFAQIDILNPTDSRWRVTMPFGPSLEWQARIVDEQPGQFIYWRSLAGAFIPNEGRLSFRLAPQGTEVTLSIRFDPPGGLLGQKISQLFQSLSQDMLSKTLQRFKQMAEHDA